MFCIRICLSVACGPSAFTDRSCFLLVQLAGRPIQRPATPEVSHEEVLEVGRQKAEVMKALVAKIIEIIPKA